MPASSTLHVLDGFAYSSQNANGIIHLHMVYVDKYFHYIICLVQPAILCQKVRDCLHSNVKNGSLGSCDLSYSKPVCVSAFSGFPIYMKISRRQSNTECVRVQCSKSISYRGQALSSILFFEQILVES